MSQNGTIPRVSYARGPITVVALLVTVSVTSGLKASDAPALELIQPSAERLLLIEPGTVVPSVLYTDGTVVELEMHNVWRYMCGSGTSGLTVDDLRKHVVVAHEVFNSNRETFVLSSGASRDGLDIVWNATGELPAEAETALEAVAEYIESIFSDPITVPINVSMYDFGNPSVIGVTSNAYAGCTWSTIRDGLTNDMDPDDFICDYLPSGSTIPVRYNAGSTGVTQETNLYITRANYNAAIGVLGGAAATMAFNTEFSFDYDPSDGVPGYRMCFRSVVAHEIGHALGFTSGVDRAGDYLEVLDIFRFQRTDGDHDYNPDNYPEFQTTPRTVDFNNPNDDANSDLIDVEYRMADGNPWQASHFREESPTIGIMDPAQGDGETYYPDYYMQSDIDMIDAIGWDFPSTIPPVAPDPPHSERKNRYIAFDPNNGDASEAFEVQMSSGPGILGKLGWVGAPDGDGVSQVVAEPYYTGDWPEVVVVGDCEVVPAAVYEIRAILEGANPESANSYSSPYEVTTIPEPAPKKWADCVGEFFITVWTGPNGEVNFDDVMAAVQKFQSDPNAPHWTWVDMADEVPDGVINFTDIFWVVQGFKGEDYPWSAPSDCPL